MNALLIVPLLAAERSTDIGASSAVLYAFMPVFAFVFAFAFTFTAFLRTVIGIGTGTGIELGTMLPRFILPPALPILFVLARLCPCSC